MCAIYVLDHVLHHLYISDAVRCASAARTPGSGPSRSSPGEAGRPLKPEARRRLCTHPRTTVCIGRHTNLADRHPRSNQRPRGRQHARRSPPDRRRAPTHHLLHREKREHQHAGQRIALGVVHPADRERRLVDRSSSRPNNRRSRGLRRRAHAVQVQTTKRSSNKTCTSCIRHFLPFASGDVQNPRVDLLRQWL